MKKRLQKNNDKAEELPDIFELYQSFLNKYNNLKAERDGTNIGKNSPRNANVQEVKSMGNVDSVDIGLERFQSIELYLKKCKKLNFIFQNFF